MVAKHLLLLLPLTATALTGCNSRDERLAELARVSVEQQAKQNERAGRQTQAIAQAAEQLVSADAQSRQDLLRAQQDFQRHVASRERELDERSAHLEQERKQLAQERIQAPVIAEALLVLGAFAACLAPLALVLHFLKSLAIAPTSDLELSQLLLEEPAFQEELRLAAPSASHLPSPTETDP